jgi:hypothetical protein
MNKTDYIRSTQTGFVTTLVKAIVITILVIGAIAALSSCERVADRNIHYSNTWRATALKTGRPLTVKNLDSLCVSSGDTVTVFLGGNGNKQYYYISNTPDIACDTMTMEMLIDGKDTLYEPFEAWNVRLERRIAK